MARTPSKSAANETRKPAGTIKPAGTKKASGSGRPPAPDGQVSSTALAATVTQEQLGSVSGEAALATGCILLGVGLEWWL